MENLQSKQQIVWVRNVDPSTGRVFYTSTEGSIILSNTSVDFATTASYALNGGGGGGSTDTGSLLVTASFIDPRLTFTKGDGTTFNVSLDSLTVVSASYASTASYFSGSISNAVYAQTASYLDRPVVSASYADTASYVQNAVSSSQSISSSYASQAGNASTIDINVFGSPVESYLLMSNVAGTTGVAIGGDADLRYNTSTNVLTVGNISATTLTGSLLGTASYATQALSSSNALTSSYVLNAVSSSFASTASFVQTAQTASYVLNAVSASFSRTSSFVTSLPQTVVIGSSVTASNIENPLSIYPLPGAGTGEGGQIMLAASGGIYASASMIDTWQNQFRILRGSNTAGSNAGLVYVDLQSGNTQFVGAVTASAYSGLPNSWLHALRTSNQTIGSGTWASRDIIFDQVSSINFTYNSSTGIATLKAGKTYRLTARLAWSAAGLYTLKFRVYNQTTSAFTGPTVEMIQSPNGTYNVSDNTLEHVLAVGASDIDISIRTTADTNALTGEYIRGDLNTQLIIQQIA